MQQKQFKSFPFMYLISPFPKTSYSPYCLCALPTWFPESFGEGIWEGLLTLCISFTVLCTFAFSLILLLRKLLSAAHTTLRNSTSFIKWFATERC